MVQRRRWLARATLLAGAGLLALVLVAATAVASPSAGDRFAQGTTLFTEDVGMLRFFSRRDEKKAAQYYDTVLV